MTERLEEIRGFLRGILDILGERGEVEIVPEEGRLYINLRGDFAAIPGGDPAFREALSQVLRLYLRRLRTRTPFLLDVNGEVRARERTLIARAKELAERALREGRRIELEPMPAAERRMIHLALADHPRVRTYSVGQGGNRHVVIEPRG